MTDAVRTPDELLTGLPDFPYESRYHEWDGLRLAHLDEGDQNDDPAHPQVWFLHGEPTWSYLWRKVFPPVRDAGHRCIVPDLPGFGRSDKPTDLEWYSYDRHTAAVGALVDELQPRDATLVVHDWGGPIGLRLAVERPECFARFVILDTGLFTGQQQMTQSWIAFRDFVQRTEDLPISMLLRNACHTDPGDAVAAAYDAPFPSLESKAGTRAFPLMLPTKPDAPGAEAGRAVLAALREDTRPTLTLWAEHDPVLNLETGKRFTAAINRPEPEVVPDASHFLQEDQGEHIGARIVEWLKG